jgi:aurora kinase
MLAPGGVVKLTDFGWSVYNPDNSLRETICGTPLYLSPELISA